MEDIRNFKKGDFILGIFESFRELGSEPKTSFSLDIGPVEFLAYDQKNLILTCAPLEKDEGIIDSRLGLVGFNRIKLSGRWIYFIVLRGVLQKAYWVRLDKGFLNSLSGKGVKTTSASPKKKPEMPEGFDPKDFVDEPEKDQIPPPPTPDVGKPEVPSNLPASGGRFSGMAG